MGFRIVVDAGMAKAASLPVMARHLLVLKLTSACPELIRL